MIKAKYTDPKLDQIRDAVAGKTDGIPFLLLPVRMETRFMKVERPAAAAAGRETGIENPLISLAESQVLLSQDLSGISKKETQELLTAVQGKLTKTGDLLDKILPDLPWKQRTWIADFTTAIRQETEKIKPAKADPQQIAALKNNLDKLEGKLTQEKPPFDQTYQSASFLLDDIKKLELRFAQAGDHKIPFTRPVHKKKLYRFVSNMFAAFLSFYSNAELQSSKLKFLEKSQLESIKKSHEHIKKIIPKVLKNLQNIHADKNWQSFVNDQKMQLVKQSASIQSLEKNAFSRLGFIAGLDQIFADELFYRNLQALTRLKTLELNPGLPGENSPAIKKRIKKELKILIGANRKLIHANARQYGWLKTAWRELDLAVASLKTAGPLGKTTQTNFQKDLIILPDPVVIGYEPELSLFKTDKIETLYQFDQTLFNTLGQLNLITQNKETTKIKIDAAIDQVKSNFNKGKNTGLFLVPEKRNVLNAGFEKILENIQASSLKPLEKTALKNEVSGLAKTIDEAFYPAFSNTIDNYQFQAEKVSVIPLTEIRNELWVRIFPDDIFVFTHEPALTLEEETAAKDYWKTVWAAGEDTDLVLGVWNMLCARFGVNRTAWIVQSLDPLKLNKPANTKAFRQKPVNLLKQVETDLEWIHETLKKGEPAGRVAPKLQLLANTLPVNEFLVRLQRINQKLAGLGDKPQYAPLLERCILLARNIHSRISALAGKPGGPKIREAGKTTTSKAANLLKIPEAFRQVQGTLSRIRGVSAKQYLQPVEIPFQFPPVTRKSSGWTQTPHSKVLPDRFAVITRSAGEFQHIVVGQPVPPNLALGMDPSLFDKTGEDDPYQYDEFGNLIVEPGIRWMTDFEEAVKKGMGLVVPLSEAEAETGFDQVFVLGVAEKTELESQQLLEDLIRNHHYSPNGLDLLKTGTPTNNTETENTAYAPEDTDYAGAHAREMGEGLFDPDAADPIEFADGKRVADALGIRPEILQHIKNAGETEISDALLMNRVLSWATIRDYMEEMMEGVFTYDNIERVLSYFNTSVTARGILPALRVGSQPYGILPTSAFSRFEFDGVFNSNNLPAPANEKKLKLRFNIRLKQTLDILNGYWTDIRNEKALWSEKIAGNTDPQGQFMEMLGLHPTSAEAYYRYGVNIAYRGSASASSGFIGEYQEEDLFGPDRLYAIFKPVLDAGMFGDEIVPRASGHFEKSRAFRSRYLEDNAGIMGELVDNQLPSDETALVPDDAGLNYIQTLLDRNLYEILKDNNAAEFPSRSLLYLLLRQSALLVYRNAALDILEHEGFFSKAFRRVIGSSDHYMSPEQKFRSKWSYLFLDFTLDSVQSGANFSFSFDFDAADSDIISNNVFFEYLNAGADKKSLATYLFYHAGQGFSAHQPYLGQIDQFRGELGRLATLSTRKLNQLLIEHLDLCYYRLDAWMLGLANQRLAEQRAAQPAGIHLGAFCWVENLRPGGERRLAKGVPAKLVQEGDTIYTDAANQGFIHAPSINQAVAAAVLRSGYQANAQDEDLHNQFAVNLSSFRVRNALGLIEGIANGQELGALLGYQFEKGLHERYLETELDQFIQPFRKAFPLTVPVAGDIDLADTGISMASNVVNGLDLINKIYAETGLLEFAAQTSLFDLLTQNQFEFCPQWLTGLVEDNGGGDAELTAVIREIDLMADAFDALGDLALSESVYQIVQGNHVRASAIIDALAAGKALPEPMIPYTPRTGIVVNHRVALCLDPANTPPAGWNKPLTPRAKAEPALNKWIGEAVGNPAGIRFLVNFGTGDQSYSLADFDLHPIDLLFLVSADPDGPNNELSDWIRYAVRKEGNLPDAAVITVNFENRAADWGTGVKTIYELQPLIAQIKEMIGGALSLSSTDLSLPVEEPDPDNPGKQNLPELVQRIEPAKDELLALSAAIAAFVATPPVFSAGDFNRSLDWLEQCFYFGIPNTLTAAGIETTPENAGFLLSRLQVVSITLVKKVAEIDRILVELAGGLSTEQQVQKWKNIAQALFGRAFNAIPLFEFQDSDGLSAQAGALKISDSGLFPLDNWLYGIAKVRKNMAALEIFRTIEEMEGRAPASLSPVQLPFAAGDYWLGLPFPEDHHPAGDKLSLVLVNSGNLFDHTANRAGLVMDEWTELIPNREETTGISFNYDQPDAMPPQSLLLAVTPVLTGKWDWDDLVFTLIDTLELAKNRAVEPDHLEGSVFGQVLPAVISEVVPPQLREDEYANPLGTQVVLDYLDNLPPAEETN